MNATSGKSAPKTTLDTLPLQRECSHLKSAPVQLGRLVSDAARSMHLVQLHLKTLTLEPSAYEEFYSRPENTLELVIAMGPIVELWRTLIERIQTDERQT